MATFYVDLDLPDTGGSGTSLDPWTAADFQAAMPSLEGSQTFNLKGKCNYGTFFEINASGVSDFVFQNWTENPWRIKCSFFLIQTTITTTFRNGIVFAWSTQGSQLTNLYDCFMYVYDGSGGDITFSENSNVKGCTILTKLIQMGIESSPASVSIVDSIIAVLGDENPSNGYYFWDNVSSSNCAFISTPTAGTHNNSQVAWTQPTWPVWDADITAFFKAPLNYSYIDRNSGFPGYGNPPYSGYEYDLSNVSRDDIGAYASQPETTTTTLEPTTTTLEPTTTTTTVEPTTTTVAPTTTTTPAPDPIVKHFGGGPGQRKIALDEVLSARFGRPWGTMADYPYNP
jgi:hypothetical protein